MNTNIQYDVRVINAFKSYGENNVLNGFDMQVNSGTIYCLFGPSGCGKSTVLQCILGTKTLDNGSIELNAKSFKEIGYMPQDLCLDGVLTIRETFEFYGSLYQMSKMTIERRIDELCKFLQLPNMNISYYINEISSVQRRNVSIAVCLLHDPKIIIMDKPTVGIDPLMRHQIWNMFTKMAEECQKTIVITTDFMDEAHVANCVGLMRNGILTEEGTSQEILIKYGVESMETCFLKIYCSQQSFEKVHTRKNIQVERHSKTKTSGSLENKIELYRVKALLRKYKTLFSRDYTLLFVMLLLPVIQLLSLNFAIGVRFNDMPIAIKNDENNILDCKYSNVTGCILKNESNRTISCIVLDYLESRQYTLVEVKDRETGEINMNNPKYMAFLHFPKNYTSIFIENINKIEIFSSKFLQTRPYVYLTRDNFMFQNQVKMDVLYSIKHVMYTILAGCSYNLKALDLPFNFNPYYGKEVKSITSSIITKFIAMLICFFPTVFGLSMMMSEKLNESFKRTIIAGNKTSEILISLFCFATVFMLVESCVLIFITYAMLPNPALITSGLFAYALLVLLLGWVGFFVGVLSALISKTFTTASIIPSAFLLFQTVLSGLVWPLESQPWIIKIGSELLPVTIVGKTMSSIILKGWTFTHPSVLIGLLATFIYNILLIITILIVLKIFNKQNI